MSNYVKISWTENYKGWFKIIKTKTHDKLVPIYRLEENKFIRVNPKYILYIDIDGVRKHAPATTNHTHYYSIPLQFLNDPKILKIFLDDTQKIEFFEKIQDDPEFVILIF
jgi:hypothetical protein